MGKVTADEEFFEIPRLLQDQTCERQTYTNFFCVSDGVEYMMCYAWCWGGNLIN